MSRSWDETPALFTLPGTSRCQSLSRPPQIGVCHPRIASKIATLCSVVPCDLLRHSRLGCPANGRDTLPILAQCQELNEFVGARFRDFVAGQDGSRRAGAAAGSGADVGRLEYGVRRLPCRRDVARYVQLCRNL